MYITKASTFLSSDEFFSGKLDVYIIEGEKRHF